MAWTRTATLPEKDWVEPPKKRFIPLEQRLKAEEKKAARTHARLMRTLERKARRRPHEWRPEELSNPDFQWLEFLKAKEELNAEGSPDQVRHVAAYLKMSRRYKSSPLEPLSRIERKRMLSAIGEYMAEEKTIPGIWWLKRKYKELKKK